MQLLPPGGWPPLMHGMGLEQLCKTTAHSKKRTQCTLGPACPLSYKVKFLNRINNSSQDSGQVKYAEGHLSS
jgi:hypothetical protein